MVILKPPIWVICGGFSTTHLQVVRKCAYVKKKSCYFEQHIWQHKMKFGQHRDTKEQKHIFWVNLNRLNKKQSNKQHVSQPASSKWPVNPPIVCHQQALKRSSKRGSQLFQKLGTDFPNKKVLSFIFVGNTQGRENFTQGFTFHPFITSQAELDPDINHDATTPKVTGSKDMTITLRVLRTISQRKKNIVDVNLGCLWRA